MSLKCILGRKERMTQIFTAEGEQVGVTVVEAGPCRIVQLKTPESNGYSAVQLGFMEQKPQRISKPLKGHFKKAKVTPMRYLAEFRTEEFAEEAAELEVGGTLTVESFEKGDLVDVIGLSKGHGFTGAMKRWGFAGGPQSHGGMFDRRPGAIGMHSDPSRVFKGKKMAGQHGNERITMKNLEVMEVDVENNLLLLKGAVPGARNSLVRIRKAKTGIPRPSQDSEEDK